MMEVILACGFDGGLFPLQVEASLLFLGDPAVS